MFSRVHSSKRRKMSELKDELGSPSEARRQLHMADFELRKTDMHLKLSCQGPYQPQPAVIPQIQVSTAPVASVASVAQPTVDSKVEPKEVRGEKGNKRGGVEDLQVYYNSDNLVEAKEVEPSSEVFSVTLSELQAAMQFDFFVVEKEVYRGRGKKLVVVRAVRGKGQFRGGTIRGVPRKIGRIRGGEGGRGTHSIRTGRGSGSTVGRGADGIGQGVAGGWRDQQNYKVKPRDSRKSLPPPYSLPKMAVWRVAHGDAMKKE